MKTIFKLFVAICLAGVVLIAGCAALIGGAASEAAKSIEKEQTALTSKGSDTSTDATAKATKEAKAPEMTSGQENALESAQNYIDMTGFSKKGLIRQLSSSAGEGYSKADATYAANHVGADWKAEAVESAQSYLDMGGFSEQRLIEQLSSAAGDGYTEAQARYAVSQVY